MHVKDKGSTKTKATIDANLINDATLLRMGIKAMCNCGLLDKAIDEWEGLSSINQKWEYFVTHFQNAEEKINLKKSIHDKKGSIRRDNVVEEVEESGLYRNHNYDINNISTHLDNLAAAVTQEKDVLDRLVNKTEKLVTQLETLTAKFEQLSSNHNSTSTSNSTVPMLNGKSSNVCNMKRTDTTIHPDTTASK